MIQDKQDNIQELLYELLEENKAIRTNLNSCSSQILSIKDRVSELSWFPPTFAFCLIIISIISFAFAFNYFSLYNSKQCFEYTKDSRCFFDD